MNNYQDKYGRYHHKPCIDGEPSSNNGWLYTAYLNKLKPINLLREQLASCYRQCVQQDEHSGRLYIERSPYKSLPPMSRDEILGIAALKLLRPSHIKGMNFSPRPIPRFNPFKFAAQLWELRPTLLSDGTGGYELEFKHRNYFWENNLDQLYRFAFSVPLTDRHFILKQWGKFNLFYWAIAKIDSLSSKRSGIRYLKYDKDLAAMLEEFPEDHPFREKK